MANSSQTRTPQEQLAQTSGWGDLFIKHTVDAVPASAYSEAEMTPGNPRPIPTTGEQIAYNLMSLPYTGTWTEKFLTSSDWLGLFKKPGDEKFITAAEANKTYPMTQAWEGMVEVGRARRSYENEQRMGYLSVVLSDANALASTTNFFTNILGGLVVDPVQTGLFALGTMGLGATAGAVTRLGVGAGTGLRSTNAVFKLAKLMSTPASEMGLAANIGREAIENVVTGQVGQFMFADSNAEYFNTVLTKDQYIMQSTMDLTFGGIMGGLGWAWRNRKGNRVTNLVKKDAENIEVASENNVKPFTIYANERRFEPTYEHGYPIELRDANKLPKVETNYDPTVKVPERNDAAISKDFNFYERGGKDGPFIIRMDNEAHLQQAPDVWYTGMEIHGGSWDNIHTYGPDNGFGNGVIISNDPALIKEIGAGSNAANNHMGEVKLHSQTALLDIDSPMSAKMYRAVVKFYLEDFGLDYASTMKVITPDMSFRRVLEALAEHTDDEINPIDKFNQMLMKDFNIDGYIWDTIVNRKDANGQVIKEKVKTGQLLHHSRLSLLKSEPIEFNSGKDYYSQALRQGYSTHLKSYEGHIDWTPEITKFYEALEEELQAQQIYKLDKERHVKKMDELFESLEQQEKFKEEGEEAIEFGVTPEKIIEAEEADLTPKEKKSKLAEAVKKGKQRQEVIKKIFKELEDCMTGRGEL